MKKRNPKNKQRIRAKILIGMIVCVLITTNLIGWVFIFQAKSTLLEQCKKTAKSSAEIAAQRIDGDILEKYSREMRELTITKKYLDSSKIFCVVRILNSYTQ